MLRKIKVYGPLAKFLGWKEMEADCNSVAEAVQFLVSNWPDVEGHMAKQYYKVQVNNTVIGEDEIQNMSGGDIQITPVVGGAKLWKIILGVALVAMSFGVGGFIANSLALSSGVGTGFGWASASWAAKTAFAVGASFISSGISDMFAPPMPEIDNDPTRAFSFQGVQNSGRAGVPIPILFGEVYTGSIVVNQALDTTGPHEMALAAPHEAV
tara:strand:- start:509 stop:1141 length:633 start_codon:yes stop_codon:yes gene_type:complete